MKERLFFYRVCGARDELAIIKAIENTTLVFPYPADTSLTIRDLTVKATKVALYLCILKVMP
jgi:hypothetical protein